MSISDSNILITGGTGSLGKAMLKFLSAYNPKSHVTIFSRDEVKQSTLRSLYPNYRFILGDVADKDALRRASFDVDVIFHFAAYKQVPSAQNNVAATIASNVIGSQNVVDVALEQGVKHVVASSTDKATSPCNAYGASKYLMECIFQDANKFGRTQFNLARYGNVIGSTGSVIPLFNKQKEAGGPLTVTDGEMTRFWITLKQAVSLIVQAYDSAPGAVVVPKAPAMKMFDLAMCVGEGLPIQTIGIRAGEKLHEAMINEAESIHTEEKEDHFIIYPHYAPQAERLIERGRVFSYTSDKAKQLSCGEMRRLINE